MLAGLRELLGHLWVIMKGPYVVERMDLSETVSKRSICSEDLIDGYRLEIVSEKIQYRALYTRWWVRDKTTAVYFVKGYLIPDAGGDQIALDEVMMPSPTPHMFEGTQLPHYYVINAYVETISARLKQLGAMHA